MPLLYGAGRDLETAVTTNLFVICPNSSGSTFLKQALATCRATWNLPREGQRMRGFRGPVTFRPLETGRRPGLLWAFEESTVARFADPARYDWPATRRAWYAQAYTRNPEASVFVTKSPPHLLCVDALVRHFRNAGFLFMVRNPYAVCEGIYRRYRQGGRYTLTAAEASGRSLAETVAVHVANCLAWQRRNVETYRGRGVFFTYETMCAEPERVAEEIRALVPALADLNLRRRLPVKRLYDETLTDMNARQIARLDAGQVAAFNRASRRRAGRGVQSRVPYAPRRARLLRLRPHAGAPMTRPDPTADVCVFTATSERFVPGTLVMLGTFLQHHPEFAGDLVVVQDGLPAASRDVLRAAFPRVRFQDVSPELGDRLARLNAVHHRFRGRTASLYYLDAFRLRGYRKVLCCDSDLLFQAPIGELFDATDALICCGDREFLAGRARDAATYLPTSLPGGASGDGTRTVLTRTFNCGFLVVDACLTGPSVHADLLDMVAPETWRASRVSLTDQLILNRYFAGRQTLVGWTYNYLLPEAAAIQAREGLDPARAKVLHYKSPLKPWMTGDMLQWVMNTPPERTAPAFTRWYDAYRDCLAGAYLRNARKGLAGIGSFRGGNPRT